MLKRLREIIGVFGRAFVVGAVVCLVGCAGTDSVSSGAGDSGETDQQKQGPKCGDERCAEGYKCLTANERWPVCRGTETDVPAWCCEPTCVPDATCDASKIRTSVCYDYGRYERSCQQPNTLADGYCFERNWNKCEVQR